MSNNLSELADRLVKAALAAGATAADALAVDATSLSIGVQDGALEDAERSEGVEIGVRAIVGQRQACVSASDTNDATIAEMAERAVAMARVSPEDATIGLADPADLAPQGDWSALEIADPGADPEPAALQEMSLRAEAAARAVAGVTMVRNTGAGFARQRVYLAASNGFAGGYERTSCSLVSVAITGEGTAMERDHAFESRVFAADLPAPEEIGRLAGERAVARGGARKPPTGVFPVIFDERVAGALIGHLVSAINGTSIVRGASWARDLLGKPVLPDGLSLVEEPHRKRASSSRWFDAEGLPTTTRELVGDGVLNGWTLDLATARKLGMTSTANASRGASSPPTPSVGNLRLTPGTQTREDLIRDAGTGLLVTSMIGSSINPTTGDYSRGASGFWIENGAIAWPVNECTIAGNLRDMLRSIIPANDGLEHRSRIVPSLLVPAMTIAGD